MEKIKLKVFTAFSGYDSQCMALERMKEEYPFFDYELVGWSEIDAAAIRSHNAVFPEAADKNLGDISKVDWKQVPDFDLFTYSSPCITADQMILTTDGYKPISEINVGDTVLTKSNTLHKVAKKFDNGLHSTCYIKAQGFDSIHCTYNHKFYVRDSYKHWSVPDKRSKRFFKEPEFVEAKDLTKNHFLGIPVVQDEISFHTDETWFWYLMGMYVGDGWIPSADGHSNEVVLCGNETKMNKLRDIIPADKIAYNIIPAQSKNKDNITCFRFYFRDAEIRNFIDETFGRYSDGKHIPYSVIQLPYEQLLAFYNGYRDSDGCSLSKNPNIIQFSSINKNLIYSISVIINKLFHRPTCIYYIPRPDKHIIEGRVVNQNSWYQLRFRMEKTKQDHAFYENGYIWYPFQKLEDGDIENVYNIEVEEDHSYILQGSISKNCQDFSICGKQRGGIAGSGTRSSLLWECQRTIEEKRPKYCLLENVKALYSDKKFYPLLMKWKATVDSYGYNSFIQVLNAADYDVPQGRERVFMVSIRKDEDDPDPRYYFPAPMKRTREITDFLEKDVLEEYYLSDTKIPKFLDLLNNTGDDFDELTTEHKHLIKDKETCCSADSDDTPEQNTVGYTPEKNECALF